MKIAFHIPLIIFIILSLSSLSSPMAAQSTFSKSIDINLKSEAPWGMWVDSSNIFLLSGTSYCTPELEPCFGFVKTNLDGEILEKLEFIDGKKLSKIQRNPIINNCFFITTSYHNDIFVWKYNKSFELIDSAKYTFTDENKFYPYTVLLGSNVSLYLWLYQAIAGSKSSYWMMSLSEELDSVGLVNISDQQYFTMSDLQSVPSGYVYTSRDLSQLNEDRWGTVITKLDMDFNVEWRDTLGWGSGKWVNLSVEPLKDGGYAAWYAGYDDDDFGTWYHSTFLRLDSNGKEIWRYIIPQPAPLDILDIIDAQDGDIIFVGWDDYTSDDIDYEESGAILRFSAEGELQWRRKIYDLRYGGTFYQDFYFGKELSDGSIVVAGHIKDTKTIPAIPSYASNNIWLVKVDSMGCFEPGCDSTQYLLSTNELAKDASTYYKVYPNPASEIIQFQALDARFNQIDLVQLMDLSGRIILEDHHPDGSLSLDKVPAGMYLLLIWHQGKGYFTRIVKQ